MNMGGIPLIPVRAKANFCVHLYLETCVAINFILTKKMLHFTIST